MKDAIKEALAHLHKAQEEIQALSEPLRANRDTLVRAGMDSEAEGMALRFKEIETGLAGIQNAIGTLSIALGGKFISVEPQTLAHEFIPI